MSIEALIKYPAVFLAAFGVTFVLTPMVRRVARAAGLVDIPDARRIHQRPTPLGGGIAVLAGFQVACAAVILVPWSGFRGHLDAEWWWPYLVLSSLLVILGLVDDARGMRPIVKLLGQTVIALAAFAADMRVGKLFGFPLPFIADLAATLLWFVAIINAFNLIDGIDGLAAGLAAIAAAGLAGSCLFRHLPGDALILAGLVAVCLAFLRYNFSPASIFLGDSGSMLLGFTLASIALTTAAKGTAVATITVPLLAVGVPVFDMALAIWRRMMRRLLAVPATSGAASAPGRIFRADMDHVHHRLVRAGLSQRAAATWLYGAAAVLVAVGLLSMIYRSQAHGIYLMAFVAAAYVVVRHLARVELWDTGRAILHGLSRPPSRVLAVVVFPVLDIIFLSGALAVAALFSYTSPHATGFRHFWFDQIPIWVGVPFLVLCLSRTYQRVWSRARISEYLVLSSSILAGILLAAGLAVITGRFENPIDFEVMNIEASPELTIVLGRVLPHSLALQILIHAAIAIALVGGARALPRAIRDGMTWAQRLQRKTGADGGTRLLFGADYRSTIFLRETDLGESLEYDGRRPIIGILDEDRNLHGRFVHGYRVMGGVANLDEIILRNDVREIIIAAKLSEAGRLGLIAAARRRGVRLLEWTTALNPVETA